MKQIRYYFFFLILSVFLIACSNNIQISEQLNKTIKVNNIEQVQINVNGQSTTQKIEDVKFGDHFITIDETYYSIGAIKTIKVSDKELQISM